MMNKKSMYIVLFASVLMLALAFGPRATDTTSALSLASATVPYSGSLTNPAGQPVASGVYDLSFTLYKSESGGEPLWTETQKVMITQGGGFTVLLGGINPLPQAVLEDGDAWLIVGVRGPEEASFTLLSPRQKLSLAAPEAPTALSCAHNHWNETWSGSGVGLHLSSSNDTALWAESAGGWAAVDGRNTTSVGVYGSSTSGKGVFGEAESSSGYGVYGQANISGCTPGMFGSCFGVSGSSTYGNGVFGSTNSGIAVFAQAIGNGTALYAMSQGTGNLIEAWKYGIPSDREFYVSNAGNVYADGTFTSPAADMAEMLPAVAGLEPGDVLVIGEDGKLARCSTAYQPTVVGVYSTKPGFLGGSGDGADLTGQIPLAVIGVVPVKVSAENGPILPGDLLVASSTPGYAMKAGPNPPIGTVVGKALASLLKGTGVIQILVMLQ